MPIVLPNNLDKEPLELVNKITYKHLKKALEEVAKEWNMPVQVVDDKYSVSSGSLFSSLVSATIPCLAVYHTKHKKDYHCAIIELKEAYGRCFAYIHKGGISKNQQNINMGNKYTYIGSDGDISVLRPGLFSRLGSIAAKSGMQDESLYYDTLYKAISKAIFEAEVLADTPPKATLDQRTAPAQEDANKIFEQTASPKQEKPKDTPKTPPKSTPAPKKLIQQSPHKETNTAEHRQMLEKSIGIETAGGVFQKVISAGTYIPTEVSMSFSTACDNQTSVVINVLQGENEKACNNISLGKYTLNGIMPARRGVPVIEVIFRVNKCGELDLSATDKGTGKNLEIFVDNVINTSKHKMPQPKEQIHQHKKSRPTAEFPLGTSQSDDEKFKWLDADVYFLTADNEKIEISVKHEYIPDARTIVLPISTDEQKSIEIQVFEQNEYPRNIGKLVLSQVPYSIKGSLQIELSTFVDFNGIAKVSAKVLPNGKYLPITFVTNYHDTPKKTETKNPVYQSKDKVEQLKDLVDLLDRGAISKEEFEVLKKKILYS